MNTQQQPQRERGMNAIRDVNLLRFRIITILHHLQVNMTDRTGDVLAVLADSDSGVRQAAATVSGQMGRGQPEVVQV